MTSSSAPFATENMEGADDAQKGGRRRYEAMSQRSDAPFATGYPETTTENGTPGKRPGRRRYEAQDARQDAPFATVDGGDNNIIIDQEPQQKTPVATRPEVPCESGRQQPIKPQDSGVFGYEDSSDDCASRGGRRRYEQQSKRQDAPFAMFEGDNRNGTETPRSAGGRRKFEDKQQHQPAPFAVDDGSQRFKNVPARTNTHLPAAAAPAQTPTDDSAAGVKRQTRNVPPPNSSGEGQKNASHIRDCPFALN